MEGAEIAKDLKTKKVSKSQATPRTLEDLLAPSSARDFLSSQYGKTFAVFRGNTGKFSALFPWSVLNRVLQQHRFDAPRLRLVIEGKTLAASEYLSYETPARRPGTVIPRIRHVELTRCLRKGATLILDGVHEIYTPLSILNANLEARFRVHIQANLYAGWRTSPGFDVHWDDHDVIIVQVSGRKQWKVYQMTRPFPLERDVEPNLIPPEAPLWEGILNDGDALYIPRGWWHVAIPVDQPTLHLTIGIRTPTGSDLLTWFADRLRANEVVRRDFPIFGQPSERTEYMERLLQGIQQEWRPEMLEEFLEHRDATAVGRWDLGFPSSATQEVVPASGVVRWASSRRTRIEPQNGSGDFTIACDGKKWRFANGVRAVLDLLLDREPHAIAVLQSLGPDPDSTLVFVRELVSHGLLSIARSNCKQ